MIREEEEKMLKKSNRKSKCQNIEPGELYKPFHFSCTTTSHQFFFYIGTSFWPPFNKTISAYGNKKRKLCNLSKDNLAFVYLHELLSWLKLFKLVTKCKPNDKYNHIRSEINTNWYTTGQIQVNVKNSFLLIKSPKWSCPIWTIKSVNKITMRSIRLTETSKDYKKISPRIPIVWNLN